MARLLLLLLILVGCASPKTTKLSNGLKVQKIAQDTYVATDTDFYRSNTLITKAPNDIVVIVSSPFDSFGTRILVNWIKKELNPKKVIAINPHFHRDGIGGNEVFHEEGFETWANAKTIALTKVEANKPLTNILKFVKKASLQKRIKESRLWPAKNSFGLKEGKTFRFEDEEVQVYFPGHAHSPDNVVVYLKNKKILFGGCMIKPGKGLGYLGVADIIAWDKAMESLYRFNPQIVVPGHGIWGGADFLTKTHHNVKTHRRTLQR